MQRIMAGYGTMAGETMLPDCWDQGRGIGARDAVASVWGGSVVLGLPDTALTARANASFFSPLDLEPAILALPRPLPAANSAHSFA